MQAAKVQRGAEQDDGDLKHKLGCEDNAWPERPRRGPHDPQRHADEDRENDGFNAGVTEACYFSLIDQPGEDTNRDAQAHARTQGLDATETDQDAFVKELATNQHP